jgi:hypothetical protein
MKGRPPGKMSQLIVLVFFFVFLRLVMAKCHYFVTLRLKDFFQTNGCQLSWFPLGKTNGSEFIFLTNCIDSQLSRFPLTQRDSWQTWCFWFNVFLES